MIINLEWKSAETLIIMDLIIDNSMNGIERE